MALAWLIGGVPALAQSDESEPRLPPEPAWPPSSHYYEARITPEGYALYVPFFLPRSSESGEGGTVRPPWKNREPRRPTERDPVGAAGRFELRTREEIIPGEFIQVYRPAVYELDDQGQLRLIEPEETVTLPKVRIVIERVWVSGITSSDLMPSWRGDEDSSPTPESSTSSDPPPSRREPEMAQ